MPEINSHGPRVMGCVIQRTVIVFLAGDELRVIGYTGTLHMCDGENIVCLCICLCICLCLCLCICLSLSLSLSWSCQCVSWAGTSQPIYISTGYLNLYTFPFSLELFCLWFCICLRSCLCLCIRNHRMIEDIVLFAVIFHLRGLAWSCDDL